MLFRDVIGKAVAKIEAGGVHAFAPYRINSADTFCCGFGNWYDLKGELVFQCH